MTNQTIFSFVISSVLVINVQAQSNLFLKSKTATTTPTEVIPSITISTKTRSRLDTIDSKRYAVVMYVGSTTNGGFNSFDFDVTNTEGATMDVLLVGGGGGGGTSAATSANWQGGRFGGGGGGGEVMLATNVQFNKGKYRVSVGNGGSGGTKASTAGKNGTGSSINVVSNTGVASVYKNLTVKGGTGGTGINSTGTQTAVTPVAGTAGGGSTSKQQTFSNQLSTTNPLSGSRTTGGDYTVYGNNAGGRGYVQQGNLSTAGAGGGAGSSTTAEDTAALSAKYLTVGQTSRYIGGRGGSGYASNIENDPAVAIRYYGGGGQGAGDVDSVNANETYYHNVIVAGGKGARNSGTAATTNGSSTENGSGDGGGGASYNLSSATGSTGGNGAGGIVVIRYRTNSTTAPVAPPPPNDAPDPINWGVTDADAINFVNAAGNGMTADVALAVDALVVDLKANLIWDSLYAIYPFVGSEFSSYPSAHLLNLKNTVTQTVNSFYGTYIGEFYNDMFGITSLNSNGVFQTNLNPLDNPYGTISKDSMIVGIYSSTLASDNTFAGELLSSRDTIASTSISPMYQDSVAVQLNSNPNSFLKAPNLNVGGLYLVYRNTSDTLKLINRGIRYTKYDPAVAVPNKTVWFNAAQSPTGSVNSYSPYSTSFGLIGSYLTDEQVDSLYDIIQRFQIRLSRSVSDFAYTNSELNNLLYAAVANNDTLPSNTVLGKYDTLITNLKNHGTWSKLDVLYSFLHDGGESFSFYNLKNHNTYKLTQTNNVRFVKNLGADVPTTGSFYSTPFFRTNNNITVGAILDDTTSSLTSTSVLFRMFSTVSPNRTLLKADTAYVTSRVGSTAFTYPSKYGSIRAFSVSRNTTFNLITSKYGTGETTSGTDSVSLFNIDTTLNIFYNTTWTHPLKFLYLGQTDTSLYVDNIGKYFYNFEESINPKVDSIEYLVVAAGAGGGGFGGGGAGGMLEGKTVVENNTAYTVTIGKGGSATTNGGYQQEGYNSLFWNLEATRGGSGGGLTNGMQGGSGGGGGTSSSGANTGGAGVSGEGNSGGTGYYGSSSDRNGAGGGGKGSAGSNATSTAGGAGGAGKSNSITGVAVIYAAGGGGGVRNDPTVGAGGSSGVGGSGGGYNGTTNIAATAGAANTGSGGGGSGQNSSSGWLTSGAGANGVVVLAVPNSPKFANYTVTGFVLNTSYFVDTTTRPGFTVFRFINTTGVNQQTGTITFNY